MRDDRVGLAVCLCFGMALAASGTLARAGDDPRDIRTGWTIPDEGYCDQPYVVRADDGAWLCVMTTGRGVEGRRGQHVVSTRSLDRGRTWSDPVDIEPADGPEASWAMPLKVPGGRVYVFYTYNADDLRMAPGASDPGVARRVDTLGVYAFKYSDDHGQTWSARRHTIPMRPMRIDRENGTGGSTLYFWGVGKPIVVGGSAIFGFAKVGKWGLPGTMVRSQGCFLRSDNILSEPDPEKVAWTLLPEGDEGLRAPKGPVSDEANLVALADGTLYATYRTIDGQPCHATSRDGGRTWTGPEYMTYAPGGRRVKHPRAANFVRKLSNGRYLYWFHNHGGEPVHAGPWQPYDGRNPAWISAGIERDGAIHWSEPEVLLYDDDPKVRISYPDFVEEDDGRLYVTETQKEVARVHEVDANLLAGLWVQHESREVAREGLALELAGPRAGSEAALPPLPDLSGRGGFSVELRLQLDELTAGQVVLDAADASGKGFRIVTTDRASLRIEFDDGVTEAAWDSDPGTGPGTLTVGTSHHVVATVDAGPRIISFVIDGVLNDGGAVRTHGWGRFPPELGEVGGAGRLVVAPKVFGTLDLVRIYGRPLRTSEAVGNHRAGLGPGEP